MRFTLFIFSLLLIGCWPTDVRQEPMDLFPADSLSKSIADTTTIFPLVKIFKTDTPPGMKTPFTVKIAPDGNIYVSDPDEESNQIFVFNADGKFLHTIQEATFSFPYLVGFSSDSLVVLNRGTSEIFYFFDGKKVKSFNIPQGPMTYATLSGDTLFYKATGMDDNFTGFIGKIEKGNLVSPKKNFPEPFWRYSGNLKTWNGKAVSLSGFRPVVDILKEDGRLDSLALQGFYSPMLPRSRRFILGDIREAPLLTPSATAFDSLLYVINLRANFTEGWLRLDAYDEAGKLQFILEQPQKEQSRNFFPVDLDIRRAEDDILEFIVLFQAPTPHLRLYRWNTTDS